MRMFSRARRARTGRAVLGALVGIVLAGLAGGCASGGGSLRPGATSQRDAEVERLKERVLELQRRLSVTEVELERLRREVARLGGTPIERHDGVLDEQPGIQPSGPVTRGSASARPDRPSDSERGFEIEDIEEGERPRPPARPPEAVEESAGAAAERERVRVRPPAAEGSGSAERSSPGSEPSVSGQEGAPDELTDEAQGLYDRGYALFHQGRFVDAESAFQQFLRGHAGTELGDNAQYWIGEARFARGDLKGALAAFRETARRFPDGNKVPDALLKAGETRAAMGDRAGAVETYREVIRRFPGTTAAAVARDQLENLGAGE